MKVMRFLLLNFKELFQFILKHPHLKTVAVQSDTILSHSFSHISSSHSLTSFRGNLAANFSNRQFDWLNFFRIFNSLQSFRYIQQSQYAPKNLLPSLLHISSTLTELEIPANDAKFPLLISHFSKLRRLKFEYYDEHFDDTTLKALPSSLTSLCFRQSPSFYNSGKRSITPQGLETLAKNCTNLQRLCMDGKCSTRRDNILVFTNLYKFKLRNFAHVEMSQLVQLHPNIEHFGFENEMDLNDSINWIEIAKWTSLERLSVCNCNIDLDAVIDTLYSNPQLKKLNLSCTSHIL
jgi:hypothetical protein